MDKVDRKKTLTQLEGDDWGPPTYGSYLITQSHELRYKPLEELTIENLRVLVGHGNGVEYTVPIALEVLEEDPYAEGDFYNGDLLVFLLMVDTAFWLSNPGLRKRAAAILKKAQDGMVDLDEIDRETIEEALSEVLPQFLESDPS